MTTYAIVIPPGAAGNSQYILAKSQLSGNSLEGFIRPDGTLHPTDMWSAAGFNSASEAISWAERHGYSVMNKGNVR